MATFETPQVNPFSIPEEVGKGKIVSSYLPNNYDIPYTNRFWRTAIDRGLLFSDLTQLDALYSWCVQSSPFLVSMIEKRTIPAEKRNYVLRRRNGIKGGGRILEKETKAIVSTKWFQSLVRSIILAKVYGVRVSMIDPVTDTFIDFPMRNIDMKNRAIRQGTYQYNQVAEVADFDNVFYFQPSSEQDFKLGWLQPISRSMIGIQNAYSYWSLTGLRFSYPQTTIGFAADNTDAKSLAERWAQVWSPSAIPTIPFTREPGSSKSDYQMEINSSATQAYPDAFRVFKEEITSFQAEVMQLILGGTLLGTTEKNTNSEQLADLHRQMYQDKLALDARDILYALNGEVLPKLQRLLDLDLNNAYFDIVPDKEIAISDFVAIGEVMAKQGMRFSAKAFEKVGIEPDDIDMTIRNNSWGSTFAEKVKKVFTKKGRQEEEETITEEE